MTVQIPAENIAQTMAPLVDAAILAEFLDRQAAALADMGRLILALDTQQAAAALAEVKRRLHSLKGEAALLGLGGMATVCHATEELLQTEPPSACVDRLLIITAWLQDCLDHLADRGAAPVAVGELPENGRSLRLVPLRPVFQKLGRLVGDLAAKTGRQITFVTAGEDIELDCNALAKLDELLVQVVRNAVDHGLDPADGRIELRASRQDGRLRIEVRDDGRGLSREAILAAAIARGLVSENDTLTGREIDDLVFAPGLSTATAVTDISGRGVGMDIVRHNSEELGGTCMLQSEPGRGTTFSLEFALDPAVVGRAPGLRSGTTEPRTSDTPRR